MTVIQMERALPQLLPLLFDRQTHMSIDEQTTVLLPLPLIGHPWEADAQSDKWQPAVTGSEPVSTITTMRKK